MKTVLFKIATMYNNVLSRKIKKITEFEKGDELKIVKIEAGKRAYLNLMNLGLHIGNEIVINRESTLHGPVIINHRGTDIALGFYLARKIYAERIN